MVHVHCVLTFPRYDKSFDLTYLIVFFEDFKKKIDKGHSNNFVSSP